MDFFPIVSENLKKKRRGGMWHSCCCVNTHMVLAQVVEFSRLEFETFPITVSQGFYQPGVFWSQ